MNLSMVARSTSVRLFTLFRLNEPAIIRSLILVLHSPRRAMARLTVIYSASGSIGAARRGVAEG
jgi:hypothetical protein